MTELYRHFDAQGRLLYVGISSLSTVRLGQHRTKAAWFDEITTITIERFPTKELARKAEVAAITKEKPRCNISGRSKAVLKFGMPLDELEAIAKEAGTTMLYLKDQVANGHRKPSPELAKKLAAASSGRLKLSDLRPDLWGKTA